MHATKAELQRCIAAVRRRLADEVEASQESSGRRLTMDDERVIAAKLVADEFDGINRARIAMNAGRLAAPDMEWLQDTTEAWVFGLGGLQEFLDDTDVENIDVNGHDQVFVTYADGRRERVPPVADSDAQLQQLLRMAARRGMGVNEQQFDTASPTLDLQLPDGSRLHAILGGPGERGMSTVLGMSIRRHRFADLDLDNLRDLGTFTDQLARFLRAAVLARRTMLVAGGTNTGKTTLLRALCHEIPEGERLITIEKDLLELGLHRHPDRHPNVLPLYSRQANSEGEGEVAVSALVRESLRMNPDRVIVGEVLGDEVIPMLNAMSQGNDGSMCTIHADSSAGAFTRLATYARQSPQRLDRVGTNLTVEGAIHFVVWLAGDRTPGQPMRRRVASVREVTGLTDEGEISSSEVFVTDEWGQLRPGAPISQRNRDLLAAYGYTPEAHSVLDGDLVR